jgi:hypothetical protein
MVSGVTIMRRFDCSNTGCGRYNFFAIVVTTTGRSNRTGKLLAAPTRFVFRRRPA